MIFVCREDNDLWQVVRRCGLEGRRCSTWDEALAAAEPEGAVLLLADDYPRPGVPVGESELLRCLEKRLRLFVEFPSRFPGLSLRPPVPAEWERVAVASDFFAPPFQRESILGVHGCWYMAPGDPAAAGGFVAAAGELTAANEPPAAERGSGGAVPERVGVHLALARIAGYDRAVFGLPADAVPVLFETRGPEALVATTALSRFVTARYGPVSAWKAIWKRILEWLLRREVPELTWEPTVRVAAGPHADLPPGAERRAFERSVLWLNNHALFLRDRRMGVLEGYQSKIDHNGRQYPRDWVRADCLAEAAMVYSYAHAINGDPDMRYKAIGIMEYLWNVDEPHFVQPDPDHAAYGLVNWYERGEVFYGDDNARVLLSSLAAIRLLDEPRWDERILRCVLANLRTTGRLGFRRDRIDKPQFSVGKDGWRRFYEEDFTSFAPHFQSYLWAVHLWMYDLTGHEIFLKRTLNAIRMTMEEYPRWRWTNGLTQEIARMILPLSFLVRIDSDPTYLSWLRRMTSELLAQMEPCGAIREKLGLPGYGLFSAPASNEAYGTTEAPVIQQDGDPACDLLYTMNYAFLGLREAAQAMGDARLKKAEDRLAAFLCRIQVRSEVHPYLDGAWMRSFDYRYWEYWGSSADAGWGPWCVESGWTNTWIASVLAMRCLGDTLHHRGLAGRMQRLLPKLLDEMGLET